MKNEIKEIKTLNFDGRSKFMNDYKQNELI